MCVVGIWRHILILWCVCVCVCVRARVATGRRKFIIITMNALYKPLPIQQSIINENIVRLLVNEQYDGA
jgi:hypothetical protein